MGEVTVAPERAARALGRPRDARLDDAILRATLDVLAEGGYAALTMEAVAARAGVGKATLYRRHAGKEQLVVDALRTLTVQAEPDAGAGVRDDLVRLLDTLRRTSTTSLAGKIFPRLLGEGVDNPELLRRYREQVLDPRRDRFRAVLGRGVAQGLVRPDVDLDHAIDLLLGPMAYRNLVRTEPRPGPELAARIVDDVLVALAPRASGCTCPAPPPGPDPQEDA